MAKIEVFHERYRENQRNLYKLKVIILIFTDQIMNKYLYTIILNIVYKYKSTYVILQNKIIKVEIIALKYTVLQNLL